jgi:glycogen debranching enzyme
LDEVSTQPFYITTKSAPPDDRTRVLKYGHMFAVFDRYGDIETTGLGEEGIFYDGTRFLSQLSLHIGNSRPLLLSSTIKQDNSLFTADLTNVDISNQGKIVVPRGTLLVTRSKFIFEDTCYEQLAISNFGLSEVELPFHLTFDADYADIFEVRGTKRKHRGERLKSIVDSTSATLGYQGLDGITRRTHIQCARAPRHISASMCSFDVRLKPKERISFQINIHCLFHSATNGHFAYDRALDATSKAIHHTLAHTCSISSSNEQLNDWVRRSEADIRMMVVGNPEADYPYAGVPWFSTVFGRDGIITALACLWANPNIAKGVLRYLAETQARDVIPESDAEPGKILHETRRGEMATLGEVPFGRYYGTVDATSLFVLLAGAYYERTNDVEFLTWLWPHIEFAISWIDTYGDSDGDGFVEYSRHSGKGLVQQGWKDSNDSVFHADGTLAEPPIALCEVQGYTYAAKRAVARVAARLGKLDRADALEVQARDLKERFEECFWCEDIGTYAIALDGHKKPCRVRTSNPGHCLYTRIAGPDRANDVARAFLTPEFFNGWGVRTVASSEARYNPMSYHNGSVWPHDNGLIAAGMARYGHRDMAGHILNGLLDVSVFVDLHRLPELFCGLERRQGEGPTLYPVACAPQAWASASVYMLLEACLGLAIHTPRNEVLVQQPYLPDTIADLQIRDLQIGSARLDLAFKRVGEKVETEITRREGEVETRIE